MENYWNTQAQGGKLAEVKKLTPVRRKKLSTRLNDPEFARTFREIIDRIFTTGFLLGDNDRGWKASFDWLIQSDDNWVKVAEGKYDGGRGPPKENEYDLSKSFPIKYPSDYPEEFEFRHGCQPPATTNQQGDAHQRIA